MKSIRKRVFMMVTVAGAAVALAVTGGYRASAEPGAPVKKTVEQRIAELETKVTMLEWKLRTAQSKLERVLEPGPRLLNGR